MKRKDIIHIAAMVALLMMMPLEIQAKVVPVTAGDGTLQAAIDDAGTVDEDVLELESGTYSGLINFSKSLTVQPAEGATPEYRFSGHAFGDRLIQAGTAGIEVNWNEVPIVVDTDFTCLALTGNPSSIPVDNPNTVNFNNVQFSDTSNNTGRDCYIGYSWGRNTLNFNNCTFDVRGWRLFVTETPEAFLNVNDCHVIVRDDGTNFMNMVFITHPGGHMTVNRTLVDTRQETTGAGSFIAYNDTTGNTLSLVNCVFWFKSGTNQILRQGGGDVELLHCTFVDRNPGGTTFGTNPITATSEEPANPGTLELKNCIFDMAFADDTETKRLQAFIYTGFVWGKDQHITFDVGLNLLPEDISTFDGEKDPINYGGQVIANPLLDSDGIHLTEGSPAINAASDIGVTDDFDGGARPYDGGFDFGADEFGSEPVPPPNSVRHWNPY